MDTPEYKLLLAVILGLVLCISSCIAHYTYTAHIVGKAIEAGASPLEAQCIFPSERQQAACAVLAAKCK